MYFRIFKQVVSVGLSFQLRVAQRPDVRKPSYPHCRAMACCVTLQNCLRTLNLDQKCKCQGQCSQHSSWNIRQVLHIAMFLERQVHYLPDSNLLLTLSRLCERTAYFANKFSDSFKKNTCLLKNILEFALRFMNLINLRGGYIQTNLTYISIFRKRGDRKTLSIMFQRVSRVVSLFLQQTESLLLLRQEPYIHCF